MTGVIFYYMYECYLAHNSSKFSVFSTLASLRYYIKHPTCIGSNSDFHMYISIVWPKIFHENPSLLLQSSYNPITQPISQPNMVFSSIYSNNKLLSISIHNLVEKHKTYLQFMFNLMQSFESLLQIRFNFLFWTSLSSNSSLILVTSFNF